MNSASTRTDTIARLDLRHAGGAKRPFRRAPFSRCRVSREVLEAENDRRFAPSADSDSRPAPADRALRRADFPSSLRRVARAQTTAMETSRLEDQNCMAAELRAAALDRTQST